jgi:hypothetical protein
MQDTTHWLLVVCIASVAFGVFLIVSTAYPNKPCLLLPAHSYLPTSTLKHTSYSLSFADAEGGYVSNKVHNRIRRHLQVQMAVHLRMFNETSFRNWNKLRVVLKVMQRAYPSRAIFLISPKLKRAWSQPRWDNRWEQITSSLGVFVCVGRLFY